MGFVDNEDVAIPETGDKRAHIGERRAHPKQRLGYDERVCLSVRSARDRTMRDHVPLAFRQADGVDDARMVLGIRIDRIREPGQGNDRAERGEVAGRKKNGPLPAKPRCEVAFECGMFGIRARQKP